MAKQSVKQSDVVNLRLDSETAEFFRSEAAMRGYNFSEYLRRLIIAGHNADDLALELAQEAEHRAQDRKILRQQFYVNVTTSYLLAEIASAMRVDVDAAREQARLDTKAIFDEMDATSLKAKIFDRDEEAEDGGA